MDPLRLFFRRLLGHAVELGEAQAGMRLAGHGRHGELPGQGLGRLV